MAKESLIFPKLTLILKRQREACRSFMEVEGSKLENKKDPFGHIPYCWEYFITLWLPVDCHFYFIEVSRLEHNYALFKIISLGSSLQHN